MSDRTRRSRPPACSLGAAAALLAAALLHPRPGYAQAPTYTPGDTVTVAPARSYAAGAIRRFTLGDGHRDLWSTPVQATVLDLDRYAGGLTATARGGGQQTRSLRLRTPSGAEYNFRSLDKDARLTLDPLLQETLAASVLQDRISAIFPLSALVVDPLLEAAGVLHAEPLLVILPDHPGLGEFRSEFAGMLGWLELRPDDGEGALAGFEGATLVVGSPRLLERIEEEPGNRVDAAAFLRARLLDILVGDWDRHPDQWRWAGYPEGAGLVFRPIPRDRDWALSNLDGMLASLTWITWPHFVGFGREYPSIFRLTWSARALDRRLLSSLAWADWEPVVADLERRLDDAVLRDAVARLPEAHRTLAGDELVAALSQRRDGLREAARAFYRELTSVVDVITTDEAESAELVWDDPGTLTVAVGLTGGRAAFRRSFLAAETREVRVELRGGDDRARVTGSGGAIRVRLIGGGGADELVDATTAGRVSLYDEDDDTRFVTAGDTRVDTRSWDVPMDLSSNTHQSRARDWGSRWIPIPDVGFEPDVGLYLGGGAQYTSYGFRHFPYRSRLELRAALGTNTARPRASLAWDLPIVRERLRGDLELEFEGAEVPRFHGYGNETVRDRERTFYQAERSIFTATTGIRTLPRRGATVRIGPSLVVVRPDLESPTLANALDPYGHSDFERVALGAALTWEGRNDPIRSTLSGSVEVGGYVAPALLDVTTPYGGVSFAATGRAALDGPLRPVVVARAGGQRLSGRYPLFDAAQVGGQGSLRGYRSNRFTGDASLFAGAEARIFLTEFVFLLPGDLGLLALGDAGRVFHEGESSRTWHTGWGAGAWVSFIDAFGLNVTWARGSDGAAIYVGGGVPF
jgi:hypothetical protein